jgi:hypothetical protein
MVLKLMAKNIVLACMFRVVCFYHTYSLFPSGILYKKYFIQKRQSMVSLIGDFISTFHRKHWLDSNDCELAQVCLTAKVSSKRRGVATECASSTSAQADSSGSLIPGADNVPSEPKSSAVVRTSAEVTTQSRVVTRGLDDRPEESDRTLRADTAAVRDAVSGDAVSGDEVSRDSVSRDEVSRDAVSENEVSREELSRDEVSRDAVSGDGVSREDLDEDFLQLPELRPPNIMPRGNVGTSTQESNSSQAVFLFLSQLRTTGAASVMVREI